MRAIFIWSVEVLITSRKVNKRKGEQNETHITHFDLPRRNSASKAEKHIKKWPKKHKKAKKSGYRTNLGGVLSAKAISGTKASRLRGINQPLGKLLVWLRVSNVFTPNRQMSCRVKNLDHSVLCWLYICSCCARKFASCALKKARECL